MLICSSAPTTQPPAALQPKWLVPNSFGIATSHLQHRCRNVDLFASTLLACTTAVGAEADGDPATAWNCTAREESCDDGVDDDCDDKVDCYDDDCTGSSVCSLCADRTSEEIFRNGMHGSGTDDALGNSCDWLGCTFGGEQGYFGGCLSKSTAGALCCRP